MDVKSRNAIVSDCRSKQCGRINERAREGWKFESDYSGMFTLRNYKTGEEYKGIIERKKNGELGKKLTWFN